MNSYEAINYYVFIFIHETGVISLELELAISQDYGYSYYYAHYILKGRFKLGEEVIVKRMSFIYLVKVMGYNHE